MKAFFLVPLIGFTAATASATTFTCSAQDQSKEASVVQKTLSAEDLKKSGSALLFSKGDVSYVLSVTDLTSGADQSKVIAKDELVVSASTGQSVISDGKNLIFFDSKNSVAIFCARTD